MMSSQHGHITTAGAWLQLQGCVLCGDMLLVKNKKAYLQLDDLFFLSLTYQRLTYQKHAGELVSKYLLSRGPTVHLITQYKQCPRY